jgi:hypothetical protein
MARVRIDLNRAGLIEILKSSEVEAALMSVAEAAASMARASAPVSSGEYQMSISAFTEMHNDRVVAHVSSDAPHAMIIEARTGNLRRALGG